MNPQNVTTPPSAGAEEIAGTASMTHDKVRAWRIERFEELGFSEGEVKALLTCTEVTFIVTKGVKRRYEVPLYWGRVKAMLDKGLSHGEVLECVLPLGYWQDEPEVAVAA